MFKNRFVARAILIPFVYNPPKISLDLLDQAKKFAPAAIPQLLKIIHDVSNINPSILYDMRKKIEDALGEDAVDGRLLMQYAVSMVTCNQVASYVAIE